MSTLATDSRGTVIGVITGGVFQGMEYDAFGNLLSGDPLEIGFAGGLLDGETGLTYFASRWYDAANARFTQTDDASADYSDTRTLNRYSYALNDPVIVARRTGQGTADHYGLCSVDREHVVIETIKQAEDGNGIIVRLFENQRKRGSFTLTTGFDLESVVLTNLIEDDVQPVAFDSRQITLSIKPYEIITLRLVPRS